MTEYLIKTIAEQEPDVETSIMDILIDAHSSGQEEAAAPTNQEIRRKLNQRGHRASKQLVNQTLYRMRERRQVEYRLDGGNKRWSCL